MGNNTDSAMSSIEDIEYDILIIGPVSLDCNVDYLGNERRELGGAIVQSGYAAVNSGNKVAVYTKFNQSEVDKNNLFKDAKDIRLIIGDSKHTCSIKNIYNINLTNQSTPIENRKAKEFASLYNDIWRDLDVQD